MRIQGDAYKVYLDLRERGIVFDAMITDPPYDTGQFGNTKIVRPFRTLDPNRCLEIFNLYRNLLRPGADAYLFTNWRFAATAIPVLEGTEWGQVKSFIPWYKREMGVGHYWRNCCEYVIHVTNGDPERGPQEDRETYYPRAFLQLEGRQARRLGPFQKPWEIYLQLLRPTVTRGMRVVDPFAGTCPLERACGMLGADPWCIDVDFDWPERTENEVGT